MEPIIAWILAFMVSVAPPGRTTFYTEAQETQEEAQARYQSIAEDVVDVVYDPSTKVLFRGSNGRARTVSVILSVMLHESGFMRNVDYGVGKYARGDQGKSWCLMQLNVGSGRTIKWNTKHDRPPRWGDDPADIFEGHTGEELVKDRKICIREGLKILRLSFSSCRGLPLDQRLRVYGSGSCEKGSKGSAVRMGTAIRWFQNSSVQRREFKDSDIMKLVEARLSEQAAKNVAENAVPEDERITQTP